jgi:hypothetical protein
MNFDNFLEYQINNLVSNQSKLYFKSEIPPKKIKKAITSYAPDVLAENILVLYDNSLLGSAKDGFLITNMGFYSKNIFHFCENFSFLFNELDNIKTYENNIKNAKGEFESILTIQLIISGTDYYLKKNETTSNFNLEIFKNILQGAMSFVKSGFVEEDDFIDSDLIQDCADISNQVGNKMCENELNWTNKLSSRLGKINEHVSSSIKTGISSGTKALETVGDHVLAGVKIGMTSGHKIIESIYDPVPILHGYCSNCGEITEHNIYKSGANWILSGINMILDPVASLTSLGIRDVYKCSYCNHMTVPCRYPHCNNMATCGDYYANQFCGQCVANNDNSRLYRAFQDQKTLFKVKEIMKIMQSEIDALNDKIDKLEQDHEKHKELIKMLKEAVQAKQKELTLMAA